ncbi:hypothetical protein LCGC14_0952890 [marine sediment metagenome]|uniref:Uncharacterized protein n=1 Tax=marine sediment metagenome TaxID=412755 RepID=A0A0F9RN56_9ZZZZ
MDNQPGRIIKVPVGQLLEPAQPLEPTQTLSAKTRFNTLNDEFESALDSLIQAMNRLRRHADSMVGAIPSTCPDGEVDTAPEGYCAITLHNIGTLRQIAAALNTDMDRLEGT